MKTINSVMDIGFSPSKLDNAIRSSFNAVYNTNMEKMNNKIMERGFKTFDVSKKLAEISKK